MLGSIAVVDAVDGSDSMIIIIISTVEWWWLWARIKCYSTSIQKIKEIN